MVRREMKKIMVVDNEPDIVDLTRTVLELGGYQVVTAYSGEECLRRLEKEKVDLVLLDIMMPGMSGWMLSDRLKENPLWKNIPVVFLTARTDNFAKEAGNALCADYIEKPFDIEDLRERVEKILNIN